MARKKARSAKQKANDKRLGKMARGRSKRKKTSKSTRRSKTNKPRKRSRSMAKRRAPRRSSSIGSKIPFVNNPTVKKVATGIGLATIGTAVIGIVAPSIAANPIIKPALAFLGGGIPGVIGQVVVQGGIGGLSNILGGNGNGGGSSAGFA